MRAVRFHSHGGTDVLQVDEIEQPKPASDEVLIDVHGAAVNPVDTYFREGSYEPFTLPMIPGIDAAGEVVAVGDDVTGFSEGDSAMATGIGKDHYGGYAEYAAIPDDRVVALPDEVDTVAAGAAGVAAVTAWRALISHADLQLGDRCLIHGGSGGVGHAAVQLAAAAGAQVITTASPGYHDELTDLGADAVFDYRRDDLADAVREASEGGVDVILDHRMHEYLQFDADVAATGCRVVGIGEKEQQVGFEPVGGRSREGPATDADEHVQHARPAGAAVGGGGAAGVGRPRHPDRHELRSRRRERGPAGRPRRELPRQAGHHTVTTTRCRSAAVGIDLCCSVPTYRV
jgi:NADPH:quinone reductase and related Zn-dependent oxidoreductases